MKLIKQKIKNFRSGQVAIIVLLVSALMMTVGLSLSKKATVETRIDTNEELLKKAFNAAESGIDYYLGTGSTGSVQYKSPDKTSLADVVGVGVSGSTGGVLDFEEYVPVNGTEFYWLVNHLENGDIGLTYYSGVGVSICGTGFTGSMEVNYFYKIGAEFGVSRFGFNFSSDVSKRVNNFENRTGSCAPISIGANPILITVTPIFNGGRFHLQGTATFPVQGIEITSTGRSGGVSTTVGTQVNKKLKVLKRYKFPSFMLSGIVSETSVLSN